MFVTKKYTYIHTSYTILYRGITTFNVSHIKHFINTHMSLYSVIKYNFFGKQTHETRELNNFHEKPKIDVL